MRARRKVEHKPKRRSDTYSSCLKITEVKQEKRTNIRYKYINESYYMDQTENNAKTEQTIIEKEEKRN